jgi:hypothetical protein
MKERRKKRLFARTSNICFSLLIICTPVAGSESTNGEAEPVDSSAADAQRDGEKTDVKHEDILDRVFSPLDRTVSDINRDINKDDDNADPESNK